MKGACGGAIAAARLASLVTMRSVDRSTAPADPSVLPISLQDARVPLRHPEILRRERK
jgi:hypothetical protein